MKIVKSVWAVILSLTLVLGYCSVVSAQEPLEIGMDCYVAEDGVLKLYVNHNQESNFDVSNDNVKVMFGNNEMVTQNISKLQDEDVPISYKCVVDVSGSMSQSRIDEAKEIIKKLAYQKNSKDSIAITALGNELIQSEYMTDPEVICQKADILKLTREDTNLYYSIVQEIEGLQTEDEVNRKKCLVIFSDGADDQATGITREEAEKAVVDSHIPVFTVGLLKDKDNSKSKEMAKILGSFARISKGGMHFVPALGEGSVETIADSIVDRLNSSLVIEESLEDVNVSGKEVVLKISISSKSGETAEDSVTVPESDIKIIHEEQKKLEVVEVVEEVISEEVVEEPTFFEQYGLYLAIAGGVLIIIVIVVLILLKKKGSEENEYEEEEVSDSDIQDSSVTMPIENNQTIGGYDLEGLTIAPEGFNAKPIDSGKRKYRISLITIGKNNEKKYTIDLVDTYTVGRSESKCNLAMPKDTALSGLHCTFIASENKIFIRDEGSTNGTFVNGVPISGKFELNQDDIILLGSYEYRISCK